MGHMNLRVERKRKKATETLHRIQKVMRLKKQSSMAKNLKNQKFCETCRRSVPILQCTGHSDRLVDSLFVALTTRRHL